MEIIRWLSEQVYNLCPYYYTVVMASGLATGLFTGAAFLVLAPRGERSKFYIVAVTYSVFNSIIISAILKRMFGISMNDEVIFLFAAINSIVSSIQSLGYYCDSCTNHLISYKSYLNITYGNVENTTIKKCLNNEFSLWIDGRTYRVRLGMFSYYIYMFESTMNKLFHFNKGKVDKSVEQEIKSRTVK